MSTYKELARLHEELGQLKAEQERLQRSPQLKKEMKLLEFDTRLRELMIEYGKSLPEVIAILRPMPDASRKKSAATSAVRTGRNRKLKTYLNPFTGEVVHTRGNYSRLLRSWIEQFGQDEVETWVQR